MLLQLVTPDLSSSWDPWRTESTMIWSQNSQRSLDLVFHVSSSSTTAPQPCLLITCVCSSDKLILHVWIHPYLLFWLTVKSNEAANSCEQQGEWPRWVIPPFSSSTIPSILLFSILVYFLCSKCFFLQLVNFICRKIHQFLFLKDIHWNLHRKSLQSSHSNPLVTFKFSLSQIHC